MATMTHKQSRKRKLLILLTFIPLSLGIAKGVQTDAADEQQKRFKSIGAALVVDAVAGIELEYVKIYDDRGVEIYSSGVVSKEVRGIITLSGNRIPLTVRITWRKGAGWDKVRKVWNDGLIEGDYTITIAKRIPHEVLNYIRAHGGNLRLKFRLAQDGILFGWDIEQAAPLGDVSIFKMPGGDFIETHY